MFYIPFAPLVLGLLLFILLYTFRTAGAWDCVVHHVLILKSWFRQKKSKQNADLSNDLPHIKRNNPRNRCNPSNPRFRQKDYCQRTPFCQSNPDVYQSTFRVFRVLRVIRDSDNKGHNNFTTTIGKSFPSDIRTLLI